MGGYESGRINPSEKVIAKIKEVFNVDLNDVADAVTDAVVAAEAKAAGPKKPVKAAPKKAARALVIIQSPMGGEITADEILAKVGDVDKVYVRVDQNAAYWVKGEESGAVNLW